MRCEARGEMTQRSLAACVSMPLVIAFVAARSTRRRVGWRERATGRVLRVVGVESASGATFAL